MNAAEKPIAGIILAAGESSRMGEPKALLDWGGTTLLQRQIDAMTAAGCAPVVVVLGAAAEAVQAKVQCQAPCQMVENPAYRSGRASSVRAGAAALPDSLRDSGAVVVANVDQPVRTPMLSQLIVAWRESGAPIVMPQYQGQTGHPLLLDGSLLDELRAVEEASEGMRAIRKRHGDAACFVAVDDAWVRLNLNTPEAYTDALAEFTQ